MSFTNGPYQFQTSVSGLRCHRRITGATVCLTADKGTKLATPMWASTSEISVRASAAVWENIGNNPGIAKYSEDSIVESRSIGPRIHHKVLTRQFAEAHLFPFCGVCGTQVLRSTNRSRCTVTTSRAEECSPIGKTKKKSDVEGPGFQHLYLIRRGL